MKVKEAVNNYNGRKHNSIKICPNEYEIYLQSIPIEKRDKLKIFTLTIAIKPISNGII